MQKIPSNNYPFGFGIVMRLKVCPIHIITSKKKFISQDTSFIYISSMCLNCAENTVLLVWRDRSNNYRSFKKKIRYNLSQLFLAKGWKGTFLSFFIANISMSTHRKFDSTWVWFGTMILSLWQYWTLMKATYMERHQIAI